MTTLVLISGMKHHAEGRRLLSQDDVNPENFVLAKHANTPYGDAVDCWYGLETAGNVSRLDVNAVLKTMDKKGVTTMRCRLVRMNREEGFALVDVELDSTESLDYNTQWDEWQWDGPELFALPEMTAGVSLAQMLISMLKCEVPSSAEEINRAIDKLLAVARFQPYHEMQDMLNQLRNIVHIYPDSAVSCRFDDIICAIQHMASDERRRAFVTEYLPQVMRSNEAQIMLSRWYVDHVIRLDESEQQMQMENMMMWAEEALRRTPTTVQYSLQCEQEMLWHQVLYSRIPLTAWMRLLSLLVVRNHLAKALGLDTIDEPVEMPVATESVQTEVLENQQVCEEETTTEDEELLLELKPIFCTEEPAREFLRRVRHCSDDWQVSRLVQEYIDGKCVRAKKVGQDLFRVMKSRRLYSKSLSTWNRHITIRR